MNHVENLCMTNTKPDTKRPAAISLLTLFHGREINQDQRIPLVIALHYHSTTAISRPWFHLLRRGKLGRKSLTSYPFSAPSNTSRRPELLWTLQLLWIWSSRIRLHSIIPDCILYFRCIGKVLNGVQPQSPQPCKPRLDMNCSEFNIYWCLGNSTISPTPNCPVTKVLLESYDGFIIQIP